MARVSGNVASMPTPRIGLCIFTCLGVFFGVSPTAAFTLSTRRTVSRSSATRACSDDELAEYALLVAVGPAQAPLCIPAPGQTLKAPEFDATIKPKLAAVTNQTVESKVRVKELAKGEMHFAHLHVVQSDSNWCALPCEGPSWELSAPKPKKDSPYVLLEAAIWRQFRTVVLYQFDDEWEKLARNSYTALCGGRAWGCAAYENHRKAAALVEVGPWPQVLDFDPVGLSAWIKDAFKNVFKMVTQKAGTDNSKIGFTYSGHGGDADGSLFAGAVDSPDAVSLLGNLVTAGGKFSMFNFGTNCQEGRYNMLAAMHPFADWILASDLNVGGLEGELDPKEGMEHIKAKEKLSDVAVLKRTMEAGMTTKEAVVEIVERRRELWVGAMKKAITKQKLRQSISAFVAAEFPAFAEALKTAYQQLPSAQRLELKAKAEASECDILVVVKYLDFKGASGPVLVAGRKESESYSSFLQHKGNISSTANTIALQNQFHALRAEYASTRSLFTWEPVTHGLGFNFHGSWLRSGKVVPRCDYKSAFKDKEPVSPEEAENVDCSKVCSKPGTDCNDASVVAICTDAGCQPIAADKCGPN